MTFPPIVAGTEVSYDNTVSRIEYPPWCHRSRTVQSNMHSAPSGQQSSYDQMNISEREFQFMVEGVTSDLIQMLLDRKGTTLPVAVDTVYGSAVYAALLRPTSGRYSQSSGYVYSLLEEELSANPSVCS